jgi:two-component system sensor histidine kinase HydH
VIFLGRATEAFGTLPWREGTVEFPGGSGRAGEIHPLSDIFPAENPMAKEEVVYRKYVAIAILVVAVSLLHYGTRTTHPMLHDVYRRLYYIPVGLSAVWFGMRGGLAVSVVVALAYVPHIFLDWQHMEREVLNQFMEVGFYFAFSGVTGYFADQEKHLRIRMQETAQNLERSYRDLKRQADIILEIEDQLRRADRLAAVGQLAAVMTHEIRNPLGAIKGTAEILRDDFPPGNPKAEFLDILLKETDRLNRVVEDFLSFARNREEGQGVEDSDLSVLARETAALLETQARKARVSIELRLAEGVSVRCVAAHLKQVVLNLMLNAVQATPPGRRVLVRTGFRSERVSEPGYPDVEGRVALLAVEDEGPGIPEGIMPRLFEPFFTTRSEGAGLGLAISQRIAQAHGGEILAENRQTGGACFTLRLPLQRSAEGGEANHA